MHYYSSWKERAPINWKHRKYWSELKDLSSLDQAYNSPHKSSSDGFRKLEVETGDEPPMIIMTLTELGKESLDHWLMKKKEDRPASTIINFFEQVIIIMARYRNLYTDII